MSAAGQIRDLVTGVLEEFKQALHGRDDEQQKQIDDLTTRVIALENLASPQTAARRAQRKTTPVKGADVKAHAGTAEATGEASNA